MATSEWESQNGSTTSRHRKSPTFSRPTQNTHKTNILKAQRVYGMCQIFIQWLKPETEETVSSVQHCEEPDVVSVFDHRIKSSKLLQSRWRFSMLFLTVVRCSQFVRPNLTIKLDLHFYQNSWCVRLNILKISLLKMLSFFLILKILWFFLNYIKKTTFENYGETFLKLGDSCWIAESCDSCYSFHF